MIARKFLAGVLWLTSTTVVAQQNDSTFTASAADYAIGLYTQFIGPSSHLYNGSEYKEYISQDEEHPLLFDDVMYGDVLYAGELYKNVPLYYDAEKDLALTSYPHGNKVQLLSDRVEYFEIEGHRYVRLTNKKISNGFYDRLYNGKLKFYARRVKVYSVRAQGNDAIHEYELRVKYFIERDGVFYTIKSKKSVLGLLKSQKRELKKTIREENLSFKSDREKAIIRLLQRYEELNGK